MNSAQITGVGIRRPDTMARTRAIATRSEGRSSCWTSGDCSWKIPRPTLQVNDSSKHEDARRTTLHDALRPMLVLAQFFAVMPVDGVAHSSVHKLRFRWLSIRVLYVALCSLCSAFLTVVCAIRFVTNKASFSGSAPVVFFTCGLAGLTLFFRLSQHWPRLMTSWREVEVSMERYGPQTNLSLRFRLISAALLSAALVEHLLARVQSVSRAYRCFPAGFYWLKLYFTNDYTDVYQYLGFSYLHSCWIFGVNVVATFIWSYVDLFLILLSTALAQLFVRFNYRLRSVGHMNLPEASWAQLRRDYDSLANLTRLVDSLVSKVVLLSFSSNLYFICFQLFVSLSPLESTPEEVYRCWSFCYLLSKTVAVSLSAARVHDQSKEPRAVLFSVSTGNYCTEMRRLQLQVIHDDVALTGMHFFSVKRAIILTVAGTIATYEIVLVQFSSVGSQTLLSNRTDDCHYEIM